MKRTIRFLMLLMLSIVSVTAMAKPTVPNKKVRVVEITNNSITVEWDRAIGENGNKTGIEYQVWYWEPVSGLTLEDYHMDPVPRKKDIDRWKITNLKPGQTYYVEVRCIEPGDKYWTNYEDLKLTTTKFHPIVEFPGLDIMNATDSTITVGWNKVWETTGNKKNITYIVQYEGRNKWYETLPYPKYRVEMTDQDTYTIRKNLWDNLEYHVTVFARGLHDTEEAEVGYKVVKTKETTDNEVFVRADYPDRMYDVSIRDNSLEVEVIRPYNSNNTVTGITHKIY